jgi:hypothetical protein
MIGRLLVDECRLAELPDLINQALEVYENEDGLISVNMYDIPPPRSSFA